MFCTLFQATGNVSGVSLPRELVELHARRSTCPEEYSSLSSFHGRGCLLDADPNARRLTLGAAFGLEPDGESACSPIRSGHITNSSGPLRRRATPIVGRILQIVAMTLFDPNQSRTRSAIWGTEYRTGLYSSRISSKLQSNIVSFTENMRFFRRQPGGTKITGAELASPKRFEPTPPDS
jgi:hypothetical protein